MRFGRSGLNVGGFTTFEVDREEGEPATVAEAVAMSRKNAKPSCSSNPLKFHANPSAMTTIRRLVAMSFRTASGPCSPLIASMIMIVAAEHQNDVEDNDRGDGVDAFRPVKPLCDGQNDVDVVRKGGGHGQQDRFARANAKPVTHDQIAKAIDAEFDGQIGRDHVPFDRAEIDARDQPELKGRDRDPDHKLICALCRLTRKLSDPAQNEAENGEAKDRQDRVLEGAEKRLQLLPLTPPVHERDPLQHVHVLLVLQKRAMQAGQGVVGVGLEIGG